MGGYKGFRPCRGTSETQIAPTGFPGRPRTYRDFRSETGPSLLSHQGLDLVLRDLLAGVIAKRRAVEPPATARERGAVESRRRIFSCLTRRAPPAAYRDAQHSARRHRACRA